MHFLCVLCGFSERFLTGPYTGSQGTHKGCAYMMPGTHKGCPYMMPGTHGRCPTMMPGTHGR